MVGKKKNKSRKMAVRGSKKKEEEDESDKRMDITLENLFLQLGIILEVKVCRRDGGYIGLKQILGRVCFLQKILVQKNPSPNDFSSRDKKSIVTKSKITKFK